LSCVDLPTPSQTSKVINNVPKDNNNSIIVNEKGSTTAAPKATDGTTSAKTPVNTATSAKTPVNTTPATKDGNSNIVQPPEANSGVDQKENQINLSKTNYPYNSVIKQKPSLFKWEGFFFDLLRAGSVEKTENLKLKMVFKIFRVKS
jgi:hypothetical protein